MGQRSRIWFTPRRSQRALEALEEWTVHCRDCEDARERNKSGVYRILALNGGIVPTPRRRAGLGPVYKVIDA